MIGINSLSSRKRWLRAVSLLSRPCDPVDPSQFLASLEKVRDTAKEYIRELSTPAWSKVDNSDSTVAQATIAAAETLLGEHLSKPYGMHPLIASSLTVEEIIIASEIDEKIRNPEPSPRQLPRWLDLLTVPFKMDHRSRNLRSSYRRGSWQAKRQEFIAQTTLPALARLAETYAQSHKLET